MKQIRYTKDLESVNYINVSPYSKTMLGKQLSPGWVHSEPIYDKDGVKIYSIRVLINYLTKKDYPVNLLSKKKLTEREIDLVNSLPDKEPLDIRYALLIAIGEYISNNDVIYRSMVILTKNIVFTSFKEVSVGVDTTKIVYNEDKYTEMYIAVIEQYFRLVQNLKDNV